MEPIAIIGIGCRFPGAAGPEAFYQLLRNGVDAIAEVPPDRWSVRSFYDPDPRTKGKTITFRGGFLPQVDCFDARFFGISPREAACMDPQQRLLLEISWEALEDAGLVPEALAGTAVGVFVGAFTLDYKLLQFGKLNRHTIDTHTATGSMMTMVSNRISYIFDFRGPSVSVDTACSSSLVAVHLACQSLRNGECSVALAGGVNVMVTPDYTIAESKGGFLSPDGHSKAFSARANGYARGEGAGIVVLKPLSAALRDRDPIYAMIRGSAVNQDGHSDGITAPRREAQEALIREACRRAGISPAQVQYVEAHGTGTPLGDPIEATALGSALSEGRPPGQPCIIGSAKTNIGHLEAAAGSAGLIKTALCLERREILPQLYTEDPNPKIPFADLALRVPAAVEPWPDGPAIAGVNSFGFGGTNAHVVLEEPPLRPEPVPTAAGQSPGPWLVPFSARSPEALKDMAGSMRDFLGSGAASLSDIGYTAALRRSHHAHRLAITAASAEELSAKLDVFLADESRSGVSTGRKTAGDAPKVVFVFTGMGPQWWAMGRQLYRHEPVFRAAVEECDAAFHRLSGWSLLEELLAEEAASNMAETRVAQPTNFALQVALAALWRSWGIEPAAIVGHSVGEVAASCVSGTLSLEDAVKVSYHRSRLQQTATGKGAMMAVGVAEKDAERLLAPYGERISIAAVNSPGSTTLSGDRYALEELAAVLERQNVFCRFLRVNVPYHSAQMNPLKAELLESLAGLKSQIPAVPLYSTVSGQRVESAGWDAAYWWRNVREPVRFERAADQLIEDGYRVFLEVGPHPVLAGSLSECLSAGNRQGTLLCSLRRGEDERGTMLAALGVLYTVGFPVRWEAFYPQEGRFVRLPAYPWQRERYWVESDDSQEDRLGREDHPLLGQRLKAAQPTWERELSRHALPYLQDHHVGGAAVCPGAVFVEMALAAARHQWGDGNYVLEGIEFRKALFFEEGRNPQVQVVVDTDTGSVEIHSRAARTEATWSLHATAKLRQRQDRSLAPRASLKELRGRTSEHIEHDRCYRSFDQKGFQYGACFQGIGELWRGDGEALARIAVPAPVEEDCARYSIHPAVLDACFQVLIACDPFGAKGETYLPVSIDRVRVYAPVQVGMWAHARLCWQAETSAAGDIRLLDEAGNVAAEIQGFRVQTVDARQPATSRSQLDGWLYQLAWEPARSAGEPGATPPQELAGGWILFTDSTGIGLALADRMESRGATCICVYPGESYEAPAPGGTWCVDPDRPEHFERLLADVPALTGEPLRGIVHLWSLEAPREAATIASLERSQALGCISGLYTVQAAARSGKSPKLWFVTRGTQPAGDQAAPLAVTQAPIWGLGRIVGHQEHVGLWGGLIDLDPNAPPEETGMLLQQICEPTGEDQVAFRNGCRYAPRLVHSTDLAAPLPPHFRPDGSYLITGGLGDLGLLTARWMAQHGARRLILMGRSTLPPRSQWAAIEPGSRDAARVAAIRELESLGATVTLAPVDVADEQQLAAFLDGHTREGRPPIRGVVHSAGIVRDRLMESMSRETFCAVLDPKVKGAWLLDRLLKDAPLDFFVLFSSTGSVVVSPGQANYASANAFLDALAHSRRAQGLPALAINWGPWSAGMVSRLHLEDYYAARGIDSIPADAGMSVLETLIGQNAPQTVVIPARWPEVFRSQPRVPPMLAHLAGESEDSKPDAASAGQHPESLLESLLLAEPQERQPLVEGYVQELAAKVLRLDRSRLDADQPLSSLGLDSMMATELKSRVELSLGVQVSVLDLLKGASISQLAERIISQLLLENGKLAELLAEVEELPEEASSLALAPEGSLNLSPVA